jgi:hypothetical protein
MICVVDGCERDVRANGLCRYHYDLVRRTGSAVKVELTRHCTECGRSFAIRRRDSVYCSARCRKRAQRRKGALLDKGMKRVDDKPDKARPKGEPVHISPVVEFFTSRDVWNACRGVCAECGRRVVYDVLAFDGDAMVTDWRLPLDKGGSPVLANRVLLHRRCVSDWGVRHGGKRKKGQ